MSIYKELRSKSESLFSRFMTLQADNPLIAMIAAGYTFTEFHGTAATVFAATVIAASLGEERKSAVWSFNQIPFSFSLLRNGVQDLSDSVISMFTGKKSMLGAMDKDERAIIRAAFYGDELPRNKKNPVHPYLLASNEVISLALVASEAMVRTSSAGKRNINANENLLALTNELNYRFIKAHSHGDNELAKQLVAMGALSSHDKDTFLDAFKDIGVSREDYDIYRSIAKQRHEIIGKLNDYQLKDFESARNAVYDELIISPAFQAN